MIKLYRSFIILLFIIISTISVRAQGTAASQTGWPITKRCLGEFPYPSLPREKWTFDGVIFSENDNGVRAIRTDFPTSYYVALDSDDSFAFDGSFSPDGKHFVYPTGTTEYNNMISNFIGVDALEIVSTNPHQEKTSIRWRSLSYSGVTRGISPPEWLDNTHFVADGGVFAGTGASATGIIDALTGEISAWKQSTPLAALYAFSPDQQSALYYTSTEGSKLYDVGHDQFVANFQQDLYLLSWLPDSNTFIAMVNKMDKETNITSSLTVFDKNGVQRDVAITGMNNSSGRGALSYDGTKLLFFLNGKLYIAELNTRRIIDLCFDMSSFNKTAAWSPDNIHFVVSYNGFPLIINSQTLEVQILQYEVSRIWGWYPIN